MKNLFWRFVVSLAVLTVVSFVLLPANAQETSVVAPTSWLYDVWTIVQPIVTLALTTLGGVLIPWLAYKLSAILNVTDESKRKEVEAQIRDALHASAANAARYAALKLGIKNLPLGGVPEDLLTEAIDYIRTKNPDTAKQAGVSDLDLGQIVMSKLPGVFAEIAQATTAKPPTTAKK